MPEEINRGIVDHIADVNMCYSEHIRRYLNYERTVKERTYVAVSPMTEVLHAYVDKILSSISLVEKSNHPVKRTKENSCF